ncbi:MAG: hypothetical protein JNK45_31415, partial [Myxococcales bacterium]|nr:hypothetical protein [Myxococcales bacterium]
MTVQAPAPIDRAPPLGELVTPAELERCLRPLLVHGVDGIAVFDASGQSHARVSTEGSPVRLWDQLPPEAAAALHRAESPPFGVADHVCEASGLLAGSDHVG